MSNKRPINGNLIEAIVKALLEHDYWMTTSEVVSNTGTTWYTARRYLNFIYKWKWIDKKKVGNRTYWKAYRKTEIKQKAHQGRRKT